MGPTNASGVLPGKEAGGQWNRQADDDGQASKEGGEGDREAILHPAMPCEKGSHNVEPTTSPR